jgi:hypothetical protein
MFGHKKLALILEFPKAARRIFLIAPILSYSSTLIHRGLFIKKKCDSRKSRLEQVFSALPPFSATIFFT